MPRLDDASEALLNGGEELSKRTKRFWSGFSNFALRDNVLEVAVGLIIAAAFTKVVTSFVEGILMPLISLLPFINKQLGEKFAVLKSGRENSRDGYNTIDQALEDGAVVLAYGSFIQNAISFIGIAMSLYTVALIYSWASNDNIVKEQVKCKYCRKRISIKAKRCVNCTSWQDGREDSTPSG